VTSGAKPQSTLQYYHSTTTHCDLGNIGTVMFGIMILTKLLHNTKPQNVHMTWAVKVTAAVREAEADRLTDIWLLLTFEDHVRRLVQEPQVETWRVNQNLLGTVSDRPIPPRTLTTPRHTTTTYPDHTTTHSW